MSRIPTIIGRVRHVLGATVTVALERDLAGIEPLWEGRLLSVGQVGTLVRIPQGPVTLLATVTLVGIAELTSLSAPSLVPQTGDRWLKVQLVGEVNGIGKFTRGVSRYPGIDDDVHFATTEQLSSIYPSEGPSRLRVGSLSTSPDVSVSLDLASLVMRHSAIVGSTGSGKTSAVSVLLQGLASGGWVAANVVVVDPHGEYNRALRDIASVYSVSGKDSKLLRVPYWMLPAADILRAFSGGTDSATINARFMELVARERKKFADSSSWLQLSTDAITSDTPIPFDIKNIWYQLHYDNTATYEKANSGGAPKIISEGDAKELIPPSFEPYQMGSAAPFKGANYASYGSIPDRIRTKLRDERFRFFMEDCTDSNTDPLIEVINSWLGEQSPISVLDFSGVPSDVTDLAIGVVLQVLFELATRSKNEGIGRQRPVLIVLEEAHRYLGDGAMVRLARESANRIAREGRKYGVGLMLVTQRPSELPATALSQCGTIISMRLTNGSDQSTVRAALPDSMTGLAEVLPSLRTGEAVISGEAVAFPTRTLVDMPCPAPDASDPEIESWKSEHKDNKISSSVLNWRTAQGTKND